MVLDALMPLFKLIPEVKKPAIEPSLKNKLIWSLGVLLIFYALGKITLVGLSEAASQNLAGLQILLASDVGTIITLGIGPIVLSSIVLQLLIGGQILKLDVSTMEGRVAFQSLQKILTVVLCFFEGAIYIISGMLKPMTGMFLPVLLQVAFGGIILMYLDEVVSKYGIGSGIGLFIAGNVSSSFLWQLLMLPGISPVQPAGGLLPRFIASFGTGVN
ncbi:MAG: preprotein translocase subunit SecY, partial [Candidatus Diapherotrites archaeon CG08_land_8_20_14_0_20_34_12]